MVEVCDVCKKNELKQTDCIEFEFSRYHIGDGLFSPHRHSKVKACSIECFEKFYEGFKKWYDKENKKWGKHTRPVIEEKKK